MPKRKTYILQLWAKGTAVGKRNSCGQKEQLCKRNSYGQSELSDKEKRDTCVTNFSALSLSKTFGV